MGVLIIGYGNPLRGDDGVGWRVVEEIQGWKAEGRGQKGDVGSVEAVAYHQLMPELAEVISRVDRVIDVSQEEAEQTTRDLAAREGIFAGISSGGAVAAALKLSAEVEDAVIVAIICDRGDRYLSTHVFPAE